MSKQMKKNGFFQGAMIAYGSIIVTKLLGALYGIPFYAMIGERGGVIYSCAFSVYAIFLSISTSGIPSAMSIIISEYDSLKRYSAKKRAYSIGLRAVVIFSFSAFILMQIFAEPIGVFFMGDMTEGATSAEVAAAVRAVSFCLLIVPFLSIKRGYLQGHKFIAVSSYSQVIEQVVRIAFVLVGSYVTVVLLKMNENVGVDFGLLGAAAGAGVAFIYVQHKYLKNKSQFIVSPVADEPYISTKEISKKIFGYCFTIVIVAVSMNIYDIVDMKMVLTGLHNIGFSDADTKTIASLTSTWVPKICMIISSLALGLTTSIVPHISEAFAKRNLREVNRKFNQSMQAILFVTLPLAIGIILLAEPVFRLFYGSNPFGASILQLAVIVNVMGTVTTVTGMALQSMGRGKLVCFATILGAFVNALLDLPLIYLFNAIGIPPYLGATVSSMVGQTIVISITFVFLRKRYNFRYGSVLRTFIGLILPNLTMTLVVLLMKAIIPIPVGRNVLFVAVLALYALIGGAAYIAVSYFNNAIRAIFGRDTVDSIMKKLHLRKHI